MSYSPKNSNGQATMANSEPVVIASDQSTIPVSVSGVSTAANQSTIIGHVDGIETLIGTTNTTLSTIEGDTSAIQTGVQLLDDAIVTDNSGFTDGTTKLNMPGYIFDEVAGTALTENDAAAARIDSKRAQIGVIEDATTRGQRAAVSAAGALSVNNAQVAGNTISADNGVSGTGVQRVTIASDSTGNIATIGTSVTPGTSATNLGKARDGAAGATDTNVGVMMVRRDTPTAVTPVAGDYEIPQISANGEQWVRLAGELADDAAFTLGTTRVLPNGAVAVTMDGTDPTAVSAEGDASALRSDPNRILLVNQTHPRYFRASADYASAQTNTSVVAAPGAGLSLWITDVIISNGATAGNITLLDGSGGSVVLELYPAVNGGLTHSFRNPIKLTANTALCITSTTVTTHTVTVTGYIAA